MKVTSSLRMLRISGRTVVLFKASYDSRLGALLTIVHVTQSPLRTNSSSQSKRLWTIMSPIASPIMGSIMTHNHHHNRRDSDRVLCHVGYA